MPSRALTMSLPLLLVASAVPLPADADPPGCCMTRDSEKHPWDRSALPYEKCKKQNEKKDEGDDLFEAEGTVWWDPTC